MAKKRKNPFENRDAEDLNGFSSLPEPDLMSIGKALNEIVGKMESEDNFATLELMTEMIDAGVTPEQYAAFYEVARLIGESQGSRVSRGRKPAAKKALPKEKLKEFANKTLWIRIQMKGVGKPPMWREVEVPGDRTFLRLHDIIQNLVGLEDYHLWQFNRKAYMSDLVIGPAELNDGFDSDLTDNAATTPIAAYLSKEGDSLEYVYDFGNDWIFTVTLKKIIDKECFCPECTGFKSSLNAIDDVAGPWNYEELRDVYEKWKDYTKPQRKRIAQSFGFDRAEQFHEMLKDSQFNLEQTNTIIACL